MSKLHLVFGGRVKDPRGLEFVDLIAVDFVGLFGVAMEAKIEEGIAGEVERARGGATQGGPEPHRR